MGSGYPIAFTISPIRQFSATIARMFFFIFFFLFFFLFTILMHTFTCISLDKRKFIRNVIFTHFIKINKFFY